MLHWGYGCELKKIPLLTLTSGLLSLSLFLIIPFLFLFSSLSCSLPVSSLSFPVSYATTASSFPYSLPTFPNFLGSSPDLPPSLITSVTLIYWQLYLCIVSLHRFYHSVLLFSPLLLFLSRKYSTHLPCFISQISNYLFLAYLSITFSPSLLPSSLPLTFLLLFAHCFGLSWYKWLWRTQ